MVSCLVLLLIQKHIMFILFFKVVFFFFWCIPFLKSLLNFLQYFFCFMFCPNSPVQFSSVAQSCLTLCNSMDCSMPGLPVHHQLPELVQTHVHQVGDNHPSISSSVILFSSCLQSLPALGSFQMSQFFASGGQSIGASASASLLPMNIQD